MENQDYTGPSSCINQSITNLLKLISDIIDLEKYTKYEFNLVKKQVDNFIQNIIFLIDVEMKIAKIKEFEDEVYKMDKENKDK
jgi:hypothetical protein